MGNWLNSAFDAVANTAGSIGQAIGDTAFGLVQAIQGLWPFSDDEMVTFFAVLLAVAAADGEISEDEIIMILASPSFTSLSDEAKQQVQAYSCNPPDLEEAIQKLSTAHPELRFGLIFFIINLVLVDGIMTAGEEEAISIAQRELNINSVQVKAIQEFVELLSESKTNDISGLREQIQTSLSLMEMLGIPVKALSHSGDQGWADYVEFSDESFAEKMQGFGIQAGKVVVEHGFILWNALRDDSVPAPAKAGIIATLAYFGMPIDAVPDLLPAIGYTDDLSLMMTSIALISTYIGNTNIRDLSKQQTEDLFSGKFPW